MAEQNQQNTTDLPDTKVLAVGSLASAARTISGFQIQAEWFGITNSQLRAILRTIGLPERAIEEPNFLVSLDQELALIEAMLDHARINRSMTSFVAGQPDLRDITLFGLPGLTMRYAPDLLSVLKVGLDFPQLLWGHSRMRIAASQSALTVTFSIDWHETDNQKLVEYILLLDIISFYTFVNQSMGPNAQVREIRLPFPRPADFDDVQNSFDCPVTFNAYSAEIILPAGSEAAVPTKARSLSFQQGIGVCAELARLRPIESATADQALRWLWAYSPPLPRTALAKQLGMSERSLARNLREEGTSYQKLFAQVQEERARNLLRTSTLSIAEIGYQLGYADPAAFTRAFAGWTGKTPSGWRGALKG